MSESKAISRSIPQLRTTGAPPDPMSLRHPTTPLRQVSNVIHHQGSIGNCFAQATSTTVRGIINWIKENCSRMPEIWSNNVKRSTPSHDELLLTFTGLFYGPGSKKHKETLKQQLENKYPNLDQESKNLMIKQEEKKLVCSNARYLKWLYTGSMNNIFNYIKINFDFDGLLTQNKDIVIRELQKNKGAGAIIGISLLHNEHLRLKAFTDKINANEIDYRTILKKENMREIGPQLQSSLMQRIQTPFRNYMDRTSDYMGKRYFSHAMTIVGYNLDHETPYWEIKNSWGWEWGDSGIIRIAMDAFDECFGISHGYIDRLGMTGRLLQGVFDPYERCSVSYVVIKPSDSISSRCNEEKEALSETKQPQLSETEKQELRDEIYKLGIKLEMGEATPEDDERYNEIRRLLRGGKRKSRKKKKKTKKKKSKKKKYEKNKNHTKKSLVEKK